MHYEYDSLGRTTKVTGPQGTNYRTEYQYNANGSLAKVKIYDNGTAEDTDYTYSTTSGKLTQRDYPPTPGGVNTRTAYSYDSAGRLEYETVTQENGGTSNLYRTNYAYSYLTYGRQLVRKEQTYSGGWNDSWRATYKWDTMERQNYEQREDYVSSTWTSRYDITQAYDKNGNRTQYHQNTASGYEADYGAGMNLSYTFNDVNALTAIADSDDSDYAAAVTCDHNNNITQIVETDRSQHATATLTTDFSYDALNRLAYHKTISYSYSESVAKYVKRVHAVDAIGRVVKSTYKEWDANDPGEPTGDSLEHVYNGSRFLENYDGSTHGAQWRWAGAQNAHSSPVQSPNADTTSQLTYNLADNSTMCVIASRCCPRPYGSRLRIWAASSTSGRTRATSGACLKRGHTCEPGSGSPMRCTWPACRNPPWLNTKRCLNSTRATTKL